MKVLMMTISPNFKAPEGEKMRIMMLIVMKAWMMLIIILKMRMMILLTILMMRMTRCSGEWCCWGQFEPKGREGVNSNNSQWRCTFYHDGADGADDEENLGVNDDDDSFEFEEGEEARQVEEKVWRREELRIASRFHLFQYLLFNFFVFLFFFKPPLFPVSGK